MPLASDADVAAVTLTDTDGSRIYRRSLIFVLVTAAKELFPDAAVFVEHSAPTLGAYSATSAGARRSAPPELEAIDARMRAIVADDLPIHKTNVPVAQAVAIFEARGESRQGAAAGPPAAGQPGAVPAVRTAGLLAGLHAAVHRLPAPLRAASAGRRLRAAVPAHRQAGRAGALDAYPKLFEVFEEAGHWLDPLGIRGTGALNDAITQGRLPEVSLVGEALHEAHISRIAADIVARGEAVRVVLVAGPSSSGKTTFSKRLAMQLLASGRRPYPVALDDYFVDRDRTPLDEHGELDYESLRGARRAPHQRAPARADARRRRWSCRSTPSSPARGSQAAQSPWARTTSSSSKASTG